MTLKDAPTVALVIGGQDSENFQVGLADGFLTLQLDIKAGTDHVTAMPKDQDPSLRGSEDAKGFTICRGTSTTLTGFTPASIGISDASSELDVAMALGRSFDLAYTFRRPAPRRTEGYW